MSKSKEFSEEFYNLQTKLSELGLYEKGMNIYQMKQIEGAINESVLDQMDESSVLQNSNCEFFTHNSTMVSFSENFNVAESGFISHESYTENNNQPKSPINSSKKITVIAQVHHELNYSPKSKKLNMEEVVINEKFDELKSEINNINDNNTFRENYVGDSGIFLEPTNIMK